MLYRITLPYIDDATDYYGAIANLPWAIWLDSCGRGRYDILVAQPVATLVSQDGYTKISDETGERISSTDPFILLRETLGRLLPVEPGIKFAGGAMGYWGYDLTNKESMLSFPDRNQQKIPEMAIGIYDWAIQLDHHDKTAQLVSYRQFPNTEKSISEIVEKLGNIQHISTQKFEVIGPITSNFSRDTYASAFDKVQKYLCEGDCYQINLAQRFKAKASGDGLSAYCKLRRLSSAPYSAYMSLPQIKILCASPERFLQVTQGQVETKPIKGTRARVADDVQNGKLVEDLKNNPKDRAENLMIVDLLRNDLGKNCAAGSIRVPTLFEVESFATVHHLVSTVTGQLLEGRDALALFKDCFPGGSVTGAPKRRAMEIIRQLEPSNRGIYCGSIGYVGADGNMDCNIAIRTMVYTEGEISCWAGGGIVADSDESAEYEETLAKAGAMLELLRFYGGKLDI